MNKQNQLQHALQRLLNCFYSREHWPKISVAVGKKLWLHGGRVDDTTREAIRYAERILKISQNKKGRNYGQNNQSSD